MLFKNKTDVTFSVTQDLHTIYCHLYHMDVLSHLREHQLRWVNEPSLSFFFKNILHNLDVGFIFLTSLSSSGGDRPWEVKVYDE